MSGSESVTLIVNGEKFTFEGKLNVREILIRLDVKTSRVAVELNRIIVKKSEFETTYPSDGDRMEIVQFVGGG